jgi:PBSX family phage portal protein
MSDRDIEELVDGFEATAIAKATVVGDRKRSNSQSGETNESKLFQSAGSLSIPYDPTLLSRVFEHSNSLRQNVDAYTVNIDGHGHRFEPVIDTDSDNVNEIVADLISSSSNKPVDPESDEVGKKIAEIRKQQRIEKLRLDAFFQYAVTDSSFVALRKKTRQDLEITGNAYWEIVRDDAAKIIEFVYLPAFSVRIMALGSPTQIEYRIKSSPIEYEQVKKSRAFRRFVQIFGESKVYFKEFGDLRIMSSKTGIYYKTPEEMIAAETKGQAGAEPPAPATEILHFAIHSSRSVYGIPRWIGNITSVLGSRSAEEVNFAYFENKAVPPLAMLVSGGRLAASSIKKIEDYVENKIKGAKNFHKILIVEGEATGPAAALDSSASSRMKIEIVPLNMAQHSDGLFQNYDERNIDKVGMAFRLPRLLRGDTRDFNRACYSEDTETLTESGWKLHSEISADEKIAAYDPTTGEMKFVVPSRKLVYEVSEELIRFRNRHTDCLVTDNHKMLVRAPGENWSEHPAAEIPHNRFEVAMTANVWVGEPFDARFALPKTEGCLIERGHTHPTFAAMDDWLEFIGYFVSEGGLLTTDHSAAPYLVYIDQKKPETREKIRACLDRLGWTYSVQEKKCGTTHFLLSNRCLRDWLIRNVGTHAQDKRIPWEYLSLPRPELRILFNALMAGDGHIDLRDNRESGYYSTTSTVLAGQVQRLGIQLGLRATVGLHYEAEGNRSDAWRVNLCTSKTTELTQVAKPRTPASVEKVRYEGVVFCFTVPDYGFFVTRRNGKIAIHGNTADAALDFAETQVFAPERSEFDWLINRKVLTDMGIRFWQFVSNGPVSIGPEELTDMLEKLVKSSIITPEEARDFSQAIFKRDLKRIDADWAKLPPELVKVGAIDANGNLVSKPKTSTPDPNGEDQNSDEPTDDAEDPTDPKPDSQNEDDVDPTGDAPKNKPAKTTKSSIAKVARALIDIRRTLEAEESTLRAMSFVEKVKATAGDDEEETVIFSRDEFATLFEIEPK